MFKKNRQTANSSKHKGKKKSDSRRSSAANGSSAKTVTLDLAPPAKDPNARQSANSDTTTITNNVRTNRAPVTPLRTLKDVTSKPDAVRAGLPAATQVNFSRLLNRADKNTATRIKDLLHFGPLSRGGTTEATRQKMRTALTAYLAHGGTLAGARQLKTLLRGKSSQELDTLIAGFDDPVFKLDGGLQDPKIFKQLFADKTALAKLLLGAPKVLADAVNALPNTREAHDAIEEVQDFLIKEIGNPGGGTPSGMFLTVENHEIFFRKKTAIFEDLIEQALMSSTNPKLNGLRSLGKDNYWRILIDGNAQSANDKHLYKESSGFMASMMKSLDMIVGRIDRPLSTDFVKDLHKAATDLVTKQTNVDFLSQEILQVTGLKTNRNKWGVTKQFTKDGMNELEALRDDLDVQAGGTYFSEADTKYEGITDTVQWHAGQTTDPNLSATVKTLMDYTIAKAYTDITAAGDDNDAKIEAIIDCCRRLGMIHPFEDANGRLIMFLVLNKLLLENGMRPTILPDQNFMVGKSRDELLAMIKRGQQQVERLSS